MALAVALLVVGCGGGGTTTVTVSETATVSETVTETVRTTVTETVPVEPEPGASTASFQMPSRNIGCLFGFRRLRCDILSGLEPAPEEACEFDWVGVDMGVTGPAAPNCGSDTVYDADAPTLAYGSTWRRGGITCESDENGLTCTNQEGHSFTLARGSWSAS
ncbi:MAG TPA: DUF6636 domain-containing protein [Gaiellaceae bacterium]|nr:DUF6636 domain-containing protein [Gaiellaceae bacterium]